MTIKFSGELPTVTPAANKKVEIELTDQNGIGYLGRYPYRHLSNRYPKQDCMDA
ncbi:hypothetical protein IQ244_25125 [Nostoc sp. LEGE 06077]|uniref:hypothetical protein n=1 Tax=Nostoc sp. LEGE 06077 TaxID=915325 RepID=UPI001880E8E9|nr:hypothetical protein [Nostoc sp. LEGE 06077]MBE9209717.1 hypothetical protein [Nostoc sp. LEGE 06077]